MRIGLTYSLKPAGPLPPDAPDDLYEELDVDATIAALKAALHRLGHEVELLGDGPQLLERLMRPGYAAALDGVFNMAEGRSGRGREAQVPALLELLMVPATGSDVSTLALALDKHLAKLVARASGLPVAPSCLVGADAAPAVASLRYPLFVKPVSEGSSMGISARSVCRTPQQLSDAVAFVNDTYRQPALVEEFLPGDEFTVGVVGTGAQARIVGVMQLMPRMPMCEFIYSVTYKRDYTDDLSYRMTPEIRREGSDAEARLREIESIALTAHRTFGCRDVSRVDLRCDRDGRVNFVEINPIPGLRPGGYSDLVLLAEGHGWSFDSLIGAILNSARERWSAAFARRDGRQSQLA